MKNMFTEVASWVYFCVFSILYYLGYCWMANEYTSWLPFVITVGMVIALCIFCIWAEGFSSSTKKQTQLYNVMVFLGISLLFLTWYGVGWAFVQIAEYIFM